jgi:hypothetical protein
MCHKKFCALPDLCYLCGKISTKMSFKTLLPMLVVGIVAATQGAQAAGGNSPLRVEKDLNSLKQVFLQDWVPVSQDGGAALKAAAATWAGRRLTETQKSDIENEKVKQ